MELPRPHGGALARRLLPADEAKCAISRSREHKSIMLASQSASDVVMMASGAFSPLAGFMGQADYEGVVHDMRLSNGLLWPLPVTLPVDQGTARGLSLGDVVCLYSVGSTPPLARLTVSEVFEYDKRSEALGVFGTEDSKHPGVKKLVDQGDWYVAGTVDAFCEGPYREYPEYAGPEEVRSEFTRRGWSRVAAFQTRNPMHRSHEYLAKIALEICDGLLIHPVIGRLKEGDIPASVRMECYRTLLGGYFPKDSVILKGYPMEMRYAGPREAILHAVIRQNFGCAYLIVGRDHAGVGNYYGPFDAQRIFEQLRPEDLEIRPLKLDWTFWCHECGGMASLRTCPHNEGSRVMISGTRLREMLATGQMPPEEFSRPEVIDILRRYYQGALK